MLQRTRCGVEDCFTPHDSEAFEFALSGIEDINDIAILHSILGKHLKQSWVGVFRHVDVTVGEYTPPMASNVPVLMYAYCDDLDGMDSYEAHNRFELIHPFQDLNGRAGRLIWLSKAIDEGYNFQIPFLQKYYYQTLSRKESNADIHTKE